MFRISRPIVYARYLLSLSALVSGCGEPPPEFAPVEGVVFVHGKPQPGLLIRFLPDPQRGNDLPINAIGETDAEGKYQLKYAYDGKEGTGAPVGWHRVLVEDMALSQIRQGQPLPPPLIPTAYNNPATTPLSTEVRVGEPTIDLEVGP